MWRTLSCLSRNIKSIYADCGSRYTRQEIVRKLRLPILTQCSPATMTATEARLKQLETNAYEAERQIAQYKEQLTKLKEIAKTKGHEAEIQRLAQENEQLRKDVDSWKRKLVEVETRNGIQQVAVPSSGNVAAVKVEAISAAPVSVAPSKVQPSTEKSTPKTKPKAEPKEKKKSQPAAPAVEEPPIDVGRLDFRVGKIVGVKKHPDADSLYVEEVDVGEGKNRTVVSGLVKFVPLEEMQNRIVVLLCNLKPAKMRGVTSEAMVMCASTPEKVEVLTPPPGSVPGDVVTFDGFARSPDAVLNPKKKIWETVAPDLKVDNNKVATYKGVPFTVQGKGPVTSTTLVGVQVK